MTRRTASLVRTAALPPDSLQGSALEARLLARIHLGGPVRFIGLDQWRPGALLCSDESHHGQLPDPE
jgi:hypothetical protein